MKVNFNNLRRQTMNAYSALVEKLKEAQGGNVIKIDADEIQRDLDSLRMGLAGIACCYEEANPMFSDLGDDCDKMPHFNLLPEDQDIEALEAMKK